MTEKEVMARKLGKSVKQHSPFAGNGLSRTAMLFKIATMGG